MLRLVLPIPGPVAVCPGPGLPVCDRCGRSRPHLHATPGGPRVCWKCLALALDILYGGLRNPPPKGANRT